VKGLSAEIKHPKGRNARQICKHMYRTAWENATREEKNYLSIVEKRIERGSLSDVIKEKVKRKAQKTDMKDAIISVYSSLIKSLIENQPYF
jgi:predicted CopG family antitoxin